MFDSSKDLFHLYIRRGFYKQPIKFKSYKQITHYFLVDLVKTFKSICFPKNSSLEIIKEKNLLFIGSYNNYQTLKFLKDELPNTKYISPGGFGATLSDSINIKKALDNYSYFSKYLFILYLILHPKYNVYRLSQILQWYGVNKILYNILKNNRPNSVIISNDHTGPSRGMILACKRLKITCIYLQHASVTDFFPPLRNSLSILYGHYSANIYRTIENSDPKILEIGMHQFDNYKDLIINKKRNYRLGIAYNLVDKISIVKDLYFELSKLIPNCEVILRPHPADKRKLPSEINYSYPNSETAIDFLKNLDVLISDNSSILLEAACMNVLPIQYHMGGHQLPPDYYGFVKNGLAIKVNSLNDLVSSITNFYLNEKIQVREKASIYDASISSPYEFNVQNEMIWNIRNEILK